MYKIYLDHVSYIYSQGTPFEQKALDDVSLGIREGCITGIIGHTGSGKSTMMQLFNGLAAPTFGWTKATRSDCGNHCHDAAMYYF